MCLVMSPLDSLCNHIRKNGNPIFQPVIKIDVRNYVNVTATDDAVGICSIIRTDLSERTLMLVKS